MTASSEGSGTERENAAKLKQNGTRTYQKHGLRSLESALSKLGDGDAWIEELGSVGNSLRAWRDALIDDLGGREVVSTQQRALVDLACRTYLMLESVDQWMLQQSSLVNKRSRQLHPVVLQRQRLADGLARYLQMLGLERRGRDLSLAEYVVDNYGDGVGEDESSTDDR